MKIEEGFDPRWNIENCDEGRKGYKTKRDLTYIFLMNYD